MNNLFIIIPIILILSGIIIIISRRKKQAVIVCTSEAPIKYGNTCVSSCPKYLSEDGKECLESCPKYISEDGTKCVSAIPSGKYVLDGKIVPDCPSDYLIDNRICVKQCSGSKYIIRGSDNKGRICSSICTKYVTPDGKECIDSNFIPSNLLVVEENKLGSECKKEGNKFISLDGKRCVPSCSSSGKTYYINDYIDPRGSRCYENCIDSNGDYNYKDNRITDNIFKCRKTDYTSGIPFVFNENNNDPSTRELRYSCKSNAKYVDGKICKTQEECNSKGFVTDNVSTNIFDWSCRDINDPNFTLQNNFLSADKNSIVKSCNKVPFEYEDKINALERSMGKNNNPIVWKCLTQIPETTPKKFFQGHPPGNTPQSSQKILDFCQYPYFVNYNSNNELECLTQVPPNKFADISRNIISSCNETKTGNDDYIIRMFNSETKDCIYPINNFTSIIIDNQGHIYAVTEDQKKYDILPIWQDNIGKYDITDIPRITLNVYEEKFVCTPSNTSSCNNILQYNPSRIEGLNLSDKFFKKILVSNDKKLQVILVKSSEKLLISLDYGSSWDYLSFNKNYEIYKNRIVGNLGTFYLKCLLYDGEFVEDIEYEEERNFALDKCRLEQELVFDKTLQIHESQIKDICIDQRSDGTYILYYIRESKKYYYIDINGNKVYYSNISEIPDKNFDPKIYFDQYDINSEIVKLLISPTIIGNIFFGLFNNMTFNSVNGYNIYGKVIKSENNEQNIMNIRYISLDYFYNKHIFNQVEENYCVGDNNYKISNPISITNNPHLIYAYKDLRTYHTKLNILIADSNNNNLFNYSNEINNIRIQQVDGISKSQDCTSCGIYNTNYSNFICNTDDYKTDDLTCTPTPEPNSSLYNETEAPCDSSPCPTSFSAKYKNYFCCDDDIVEIEADKNGRYITLLIKKIDKRTISTSQGDITLCLDKFYGYKLDFMRPYQMIDTLTNINSPDLQYALNVNPYHEYKLFFNKKLENTSLIKYGTSRNYYISIKSEINDDFNNIYKIVYNNPMFTEEQTITTSIGDITKDVSISPDGKYMAAVINNYILYTDNYGVDWKYWKNPR